MSSGFGDLTRQASQMVAAGDLAGAQELLGEALTNADPSPANATGDLAEAAGLQARVLIALGEPHSARGWAAFAHSAANRLYGPTDQRSVAAAATLAAVLHRVGSHDRSALLYRDVIIELTATDGPESLRVLAAHADLATVEYARGECEVARTRLQEAWDLHREVYGDGHLSGIKMLARLGAMQRDCGHFTEGHGHLALARELCREHLPADHPLATQVAALARAAANPDHVCADEPPVSPGRHAADDPPTEPTTGRYPADPADPETGHWPTHPADQPDPDARHWPTHPTDQPDPGTGHWPTHPTERPDPVRQAEPGPYRVPPPREGGQWDRAASAAAPLVDEPPAGRNGRTGGWATEPALPPTVPALASLARATRALPPARASEPEADGVRRVQHLPARRHAALPARIHRPPVDRRRTAPVVLAGLVVVLLGAGAVIAGFALVDDQEAEPGRDGGAPSGSPLPAPATPAAPGTPPGEVTLADGRDRVTLGWVYPYGAEGPVVVSGGRSGQEPSAIQELPAGTTSFVVYGLDQNTDFCFSVAVVYSADTVGRARPVCTSRSGASPER
nr:tetratricopeptide repeat protein [Micromonospora sp. DSM 115978]